VPIAFHDDESVEKLGFAAFFHMEIVNEFAYGALLFLNARGEPQEFVFNRLVLLNAQLWRAPDREAGAARRLCASLFPTASLSPQFLMFRLEELCAEFFEGESGLRLDIPVAGVSVCGEEEGALETFDGAGEACFVRVEWTSEAPQSPLFDLLVKRGLIVEPFNRAAAGLREAYE